MRQYWFFFVLILLVSACAEKEDVADPDPGYAYFPIDTGRYVIYRVDSIYHDQPEADIPGVHDTTHYFLKEIIDSEFPDAQDEKSQRIVRYKKATEDAEWTLTDIWASKRNANNAERVEENQRFVKMAFPISDFSTWDGNALNNLDEWRYAYMDLYTEYQVEELIFPETVTVMERDFLTEVDDQYAFSVYARDVGLIYRQYKNLYTRPSYLNNRVAENIISGNEYTWEIIEHGYE